MSPPGNLYLSGLVRLRADDPPAHTLAIVAGVALCQTLRSASGAAMALKWPNDVMAGDAKLAGILLERRGDAVACGFGANLAHHPDLPDRSTTSLATLSGRTVDAAVVGDALARRFAVALTDWRRGGIDAVIPAWLALAHPVGTPLAVSLPDGEMLRGAFAGLERDGAFRLTTGCGVRIVHAGDVAPLAAAAERP